MEILNARSGPLAGLQKLKLKIQHLEATVKSLTPKAIGLHACLVQAGLPSLLGHLESHRVEVSPILEHAIDTVCSHQRIVENILVTHGSAMSSTV